MDYDKIKQYADEFILEQEKERKKKEEKEEQERALKNGRERDEILDRIDSSPYKGNEDVPLLAG
jgi:hypothetical protein